ncbi:MAG: glycosyltransferase [Dysgonamonadaceae bacterium]|jgi:glucosyltransferase|nr:glycosyltransferase [Dysgonamonadaceae bacterium]
MIIESERIVKNPFVSVIVITYNQEKYIHQTLDSILQQACKFDWELIVAEDCGTDNTRQICIDYQKQYPEKIKLLLQDSNKGVMGNYLNVLSLCRGEYIAQCSGDDYWTDNNKLQKQVDFLENNKEYGLIFTDTDKYYENKKCFERAVLKNKINSNYGFIDHLIKKGFCAPATWVYRSKFSPVNFHYEKKNYVDESFVYLLDMFQISQVYFLKETTAVYRIIPNSVSFQIDIKRKYCFLKGLFEIQKVYLEKYNVASDIRFLVYLGGYLELLHLALQCRDDDFLCEAELFFKKQKQNQKYESYLLFPETLAMYRMSENAAQLLGDRSWIAYLLFWYKYIEKVPHWLFSLAVFFSDQQSGQNSLRNRICLKILREYCNFKGVKPDK